MKIEDVFDQLKKSETTKAVNRLRRLVAEFATPEAFFLASRGDITRQWNKLTPNSPRGLGAGFWNVYDKALYLFRTAPAPAPSEAHDPLEETLSATEILLVAELMERFKKQSVTIRWILQQVTLARG